MNDIDLKNLRNQAEQEIKKAKNLNELNKVFKEYLGKKGQVSLIFKKLKNAAPKQRISVRKELNSLKSFLQLEFKKKQEQLEISNSVEQKTWFDVTAPGHKEQMGHLHPLTIVKREIMIIFQEMGFEVAQGPEVENDWYNFDALNMPKHHPARDMWDTFWLKPRKSDLLLRTHTSPVQIRYMEKHKPPLKIIAPGKVFRHEATDASHAFQLYQLEGLMIDRDISVSNFKAIIYEFLKRFFKKNVSIRLRPSYFPFTEPSFEIDMGCTACEGKGCSVCSQTGWLEMAGAGMVNPNVLKNVGLDSKEWQGFAFGFGIDRLTMMRYKIPEIRLFHSGDLRFLKQF